MMYCYKCGEKLPEEAYFCPKCGVKIEEKVAGVSDSREELKDKFTQMGIEIEKALSIAAKEIEKAFRNVGDNLREGTNKEIKICPHCGERNLEKAYYCYKCGGEIKKAN